MPHRNIGPKYITKILRDSKIKFVKEKVFKECKNKNPLPFDFFCRTRDEDGEWYWWAMEFDGRQHFDITHKFTPDLNALKHRKQLDKIKNNFCFKEGIDLVRIPYYIEDITIEDLLPKTSRFLLLNNKDVKAYYEAEREYRGDNEVHSSKAGIRNVSRVNSRRARRKPR